MENKTLLKLTWDDVRKLELEELEDLHAKVKAIVLSIQSKREIDLAMNLGVRSLTAKLYKMQKLSGTITGHLKTLRRAKHDNSVNDRAKLKEANIKITSLKKKIKELLKINNSLNREIDKLTSVVDD